MKRLFLLIFVVFLSALLSAPSAFAAFDHSHAAWDELLQRHVKWISGGTASVVDYAGFQKEESALNAYLDELSAVPESEFSGWSKDQQLAFLINAYNAFTIKLILTEYPDLDSIKDLGGLFTNPWKKEFFTLLGEKRHLDWVEHERIREPGVYDDPRIHAAVNCASIGCPALRPEAFVAEKLDEQMEDNMRRFLSDRSRNRFNSQKKHLELNKIFDWYGEDFTKGFRGANTLGQFLIPYADLLADDEADQAGLASGNMPIRFLEYDWRLNDISK